MDATTHITEDLRVWQRYRYPVADNGCEYDAGVVLYVAPAVHGDSQIIYAASNGGDTLIGWLDDEDLLTLAVDELELDRDTWEHEDMSWIRRAIEEINAWPIWDRS